MMRMRVDRIMRSLLAWAYESLVGSEGKYANTLKYRRVTEAVDLNRSRFLSRTNRA